MNKENIERIGLQIDRIDNCVAMLDNDFLPLKIHIESLKEILPDISNELKNVFYDIGGDKHTWSY